MVDAEAFVPSTIQGDKAGVTLQDIIASSDAAMKQVIYSDILILNKTDLVSQEKIQELETYLSSMKKGVRILKAQYGRVPLSLILDVNLAESGSYAQEVTELATESNHLNNDGFMSMSFESQSRFKIREFQHFLDNQLPDNVFRGKGILWFDESPGRHLFQLSGKRFTIDDTEWVTPPKNQLVLIGRHLNILHLQQLLNNCLTRVPHNRQ